MKIEYGGVLQKARLVPMHKTDDKLKGLHDDSYPRSSVEPLQDCSCVALAWKPS